MYVTEFEECLHNCVPTTFVPLTAKSPSEDWKLNRGDLIVRTCAKCGPKHRNIVYKRLSDAGTIDYRGLFLETWKSHPLGGSNLLNKDFALYSSVAEAQARRALHPHSSLVCARPSCSGNVDRVSG